ncbi:SEC-C metal-binding domain-containing protein [Bacillus sp. N9]
MLILSKGIYFDNIFKRLDEQKGAAKLKIGRNDPCPCGSGKKYKKCCIEKLESSRNSNHIWTLKQVEQMETDHIFKKLNNFGVPVSEETFISEIKDFSSAEEMMQEWEEAIS